MLPNELLKSLLTELGIEKLHSLHRAMLEECCETVLKSTENRDPNILKLAVQVAFVTSNTSLRALLNGGLMVGDVISLNYRGQTFTIDKNSPLLKDS